MWLSRAAPVHCGAAAACSGRYSELHRGALSPHPALNAPTCALPFSTARPHVCVPPRCLFSKPSRPSCCLPARAASLHALAPGCVVCLRLPACLFVCCLPVSCFAARPRAGGIRVAAFSFLRRLFACLSRHLFGRLLTTLRLAASLMAWHFVVDTFSSYLVCI